GQHGRSPDDARLHTLLYGREDGVMQDADAFSRSGEDAAAGNAGVSAAAGPQGQGEGWNGLCRSCFDFG
ncbi:hypothetical protein, partial [Akkermansia sp.]|uniref:hypothetical protein n=1 Tax=Akkermansia sp. TaxID=1872421 RepID=UPI003AB84D51